MPACRETKLVVLRLMSFEQVSMLQMKLVMLLLFIFERVDYWD